MKKISSEISIPEINESLKDLSKENEIFTKKSMSISNRIFEFISLNSWPQKVLAEKMNKSEAEISKLLSGAHNYTLRTLSKIEAVLGIDVVIVSDFEIPKFESNPVLEHQYSIEKEIQESEKEERIWKDTEKIEHHRINEKAGHVPIAMAA